MVIEFLRTEMLLGPEAMERLSGSRVAVFGIGGVGSFAVEALARTGVSNFILVDHDSICPSNINRQIHALHTTIGRPKVEVMRERILDINPLAKVDVYEIFFSEDTLNIITLDLDYIIDAIDTVSSKIALIANAKRMTIPIISCMGTGNKLDPSRFEIADIYETSICPLARVMRRELRKRDIPALKVVYSREEPLIPLINDESEFCSNEGGQALFSRRQVPGSISFVPASAGLLLASQVIKDLLEDSRISFSIY